MACVCVCERERVMFMRIIKVTKRKHLVSMSDSFQMVLCRGQIKYLL